MKVSEEKQKDSVNEQLQMLTKISLGYNPAAVSANELAGDALKMWDILNIVRKGRPAEGDPNRSVYDKALLGIGNKDRDAAAQKLLQALMESVDALSTKIQSGRDAGENTPALKAMIAIIQSEMNTYNPYFKDYLSYRDKSTRVEELRIALGKSEAGPTMGSATGISERSSIVEMTDFDFGRIFYLQFKNGVQVFSMGGKLTDEQISIFGNNEAPAQKFLGALGNAIAAQLNGEASDIGTKELLEAMKGITNPQVLGNGSFKEAMKLLSAGKRNEALVLLQNEELGALMNGIYDSANNQMIVRVDQRAVTVYSGKATVSMDLWGSMDEFLGYLKSPDWRAYGRAVVSLVMSAAWDYLNLTGEMVAGKMGAGGTLVQTGKPTRLTGHANVVSITPQLWLSSSFRHGRPLQAILHCNLGYTSAGLDQPISAMSQTGQPKEARAEKKGFNVNIYGVEMRFPAHFGLKDPVRFERIGAGGIGGIGTYGLASVSYTPYETDRTRIQVIVTPMYTGILNTMKEWVSMPSLEVGAQWIRQTRQRLFSIEPKVRVEYSSDSHAFTVDAGAGVTWKPASNWEFSLRGGAVGDAGGIYTRNIPTTGYVSAGVKWYAVGAPLKTRPAATTIQALPTKLTKTPAWSQKVMEAYNSAVQLFESKNRADIEAVNGEKGQNLARELATCLEGQVGTDKSATVKAIGEMPAYQTAISLLRAGRLGAGIRQLQKAGAFETTK
jgi:hypothetical protein